METFGNGQSSSQDEASRIAGKVGTATSNVLDATKSAGRQVGAVAREEASGLKRELDDLIGRLPSMSAAAMEEAKQDFLNKMATAKEAAKGISDNVRQQITRRAEDTAAYVKEQPLRSMGMAVGAGIILGLLMSRGGGRDRD
ncbi:ElaB/YgaM/YqjD family protein [Cupriavidus sp. 8B]